MADIMDNKVKKEDWFQVKGWRTDCFTNETEEVILDCYIRIDPSEYCRGAWIYITNGPTGYESAEVCRLLQNDKNWDACFGTPNRWDRLVVDGKDLNQKLRERI